MSHREFVEWVAWFRLKNAATQGGGSSAPNQTWENHYDTVRSLMK